MKQKEINKIKPFYHSLSELEKDIQWLIHDCSLPYFLNFEVSKYEYDTWREELKSCSDVNNNLSLEYYEKIFDAFDLKKPMWTSKIDEEMLPAFALIPERGICIILKKMPNSVYKCESQRGIHYIEFKEAALYTPVRKKRETKIDKSAFGVFKRIALKEKSRIVQAGIATLSINFFALGISLFSKQVYDRVVPTHGLDTLIWLVVGVFIAVALEMILKIARSIILDHASIQIDKRYSHNIFNRFLKIRFDAIPQSVGTLSSQLNSYISIRSFISSAAVYFIIDLPFVMFFLAVIIMIGGWYMGLIPLIFFILSLLMAFYFKKKIELLTMQSVAASNKKLGLLVEAVENIEHLKASGHGYAVLNQWNALSEDAIYDDIAIRHYSELASYIAVFFQQMSYIALIALGAYLLSTTNTLTMGAIIAITILSGRVLAPIARMPGIFVQWGKAKMALEDIERVYALPSDNEGVEKPLFPQINTPVYQCQDVKFSYGEDKASVNISNLTIKPGEKVALLGAIGSGKSTLLKILSGLYAPTEGKVLVDNLDIQQISRDHLASMIGYLPQATRLISGTLRDNLLLGLVGVDDMQIMEAAKKTGLSAFIGNLPKGLDTPIPEGGKSVSGGQRQLILITRMVLANPNVWLLDEPTANMDDTTERRILEVLRATITEEKTLVLVTHKPALLQLVDRIVIMGAQGVVMDGPKQEVLKRLIDLKSKQKESR